MMNVIITTLNQFSIEGIINILATRQTTIPCIKYIYELICLNHLNIFFEPLIRISFTTEKRPKEIKGAYNDISLPDLSIFNNAIARYKRKKKVLRNAMLLISFFLIVEAVLATLSKHPIYTTNEHIL